MSDPDYRRAEQGSTSDNWYLGLEIEQQREHEALAEDNTTCLTMVVNDKELLKTVGIAPTLADQRLFNRGRHAEDKDANKCDEFCHSVMNIANEQAVWREFDQDKPCARLHSIQCFVQRTV